MIMRSLFVVCLILSSTIGFAQSDSNTKTGADVPFATIEKVPVYPGCKGSTNNELKTCMSQKISAFVAENFNLNLADSLNLNKGRHRIAVQFKIDNQGFVKDIRARAPHPVLEEESIRVVSALPKMEAGEQRGEKVNVLYALPIIFEVEGPKRPNKQKRTKGN